MHHEVGQGQRPLVARQQRQRGHGQQVEETDEAVGAQGRHGAVGHGVGAVAVVVSVVVVSVVVFAAIVVAIAVALSVVVAAAAAVFAVGLRRLDS